MIIIYRMVVVLVLAGVTVHIPSPSKLYAQLQLSDAAKTQGIYGLQVTAVRELPQSAGIELVFSEPSAAILREFSSRAAGHDVGFFVNGRKLATLKLLEPIVGNSVLLTGNFSSEFKTQLMGSAANIVDIKLD